MPKKSLKFSLSLSHTHTHFLTAGHGGAQRQSTTIKKPSISITIAIAFGIFLGCMFAVLSPNGLFFSSDSPSGSRLPPIASSDLKTGVSGCESTEQAKNMKLEIVMLSEKYDELKKRVREFNEKLLLAEHVKNQAQNQVVGSGEQPKAGAFGTVKGPRFSPMVIPDESVNPRLAKILEGVAAKRELIVALANSNVKPMLELWFSNIKRVGILNYLVVPLDENVVDFCKSNGVPVYKRDPDDGIDSVAKTGTNHAVSGLKFRILREFLQPGYSVLLSDVDIVYLQNPFDHLYRDSDVESMSDGHKI